jgi:tripartite-type tricarboxylate transporter receptor subunit TctC
VGNYLAKTAPRDGTAIGVTSPLVLFEPVFAGPRSVAQFRGSDLTMIGNGATAHWALLARRSAEIASLNDLKRKELVVGATAHTSAGYILTHAMKEALGLDRLKIVTGYAGVREIISAVNRGEVFGCVMDLEDVMAIAPRWLTGGDMTVVALLSPRNMGNAPWAQAPSVLEFVMDEDAKQALNVILASTMLSRPLMGPPDIPLAQTKLLRQGLLSTLADPEFVADASRLSIRPEATSGEQMQDMVGKAYQLPTKIFARLRSVLAD